jgi:hypothetical protein
MQADGSHAGDVLGVCRWISKERITGHVRIAHVYGRYASTPPPFIYFLIWDSSGHWRILLVPTFVAMFWMSFLYIKGMYNHDSMEQFSK